MAASKTRKFKHMYQIIQRETLSLVFEQILAWVNRGHHQTFLSNNLENIVPTRNIIV